MEEKKAQDRAEALARELVEAVRETGNPALSRRDAKTVARELELALISLDAIRAHGAQERGAA